MRLIFSILKKVLCLPFKISKFLVMLPVKVFTFMMNNVIFFAVLKSMKILFAAFFKALTNPLVLGLLTGGGIAFVMMDEKRREKVLGRIGL